MSSTGQCIALAHGSKEAIQACLDNRPPTALYGYIPSISLGAIFMVVFGISGFTHLAQLLYSRRYWWMGFFVAGNILEILGWAGRLAAHYAPLNFSLYVMQICTLIIAPAFMSASLYWAGGIVVSHLDPSKSWLSGKWFKVVFMIADLISLLIQTIGGGLAGSAAGSKPKPKQLRMGSDIMLAGIIVQLAVMVFYVAYMAIWAFLARHAVKGAGGRMQFMLLALFASSLGIIVRGCYRTPELHEGFKGWIATQQVWMLFDAIPIAFSTFVLNVIHPHWFLVYPHDLDAAYSSEKQTSPFSPTPTVIRQDSDKTVAHDLQHSHTKEEKGMQQV